ncbi:MAG: hypothetical protein ABIR66_13985 [Saprospiraceae bacterium]
MNKPYNSPIPIILLLFFSCNIADIKLEQQQGEWAIPLIQGEIKVADLINQATTNATLQVLPDGLLNLRYTGDVLQKTKKDIFTPIPGGIPIPMLDTVNLVTLPVVNNVIIKKAILANGNYFIQFTHNRAEPVQLKMWVPEMKLNNQIIRLNINIPYNGNVPVSGISDKFPFDDIVMIPVDNKIGLHYQAMNANNEIFKMSSIFFLYDQIDFKYIEGFIGQNVYDLQKDSIDIDLYDSFVQGSIYIDDPKVTVTVNSSFGFPTKALVNQFDLQSRDGSLITFKSKILDEGMYFDYPKLAEAGQTKSTTFVFTKTNSNISEVFNTQAKRVIYDIDALSNPLLKPDSTTFILENSKFTINLTVDLPLKGNVSQYPASRIFETDASSLNDLAEGALLIESTNGIALSANAQLYLYNANNQLIDSVFTTPQPLFKSALTDAQGYSIQPVTNMLTIPIAANKISHWSQTRKIKVSAVFNTPAGKTIIQITNKDVLKLRIGFVGKLKL